MRIVIDARLYGLENAGLGRYVMNLISELQKQDKKNKYVLLLRKKYFDKLKLPKKWDKVLVDFRHYGLREQVKLPGIINKLNPDLVHFPHFNVPTRYGGKFVVTIHDILMHKQKGKDATTLPWFVYGIKRLGYKFIFKRAVLASERILVPSEFVKREIVDYYKTKLKKVIVTYEGVNTPELKKISLKKYNLKQPYFIYTGNAYPHKNLERAIEAITHLNVGRKKKVSFVIVSSRNVFTKRLERTIKKHEAGEYIKLLGFVPDRELVALYRLSEAFLYPSTYEGFGLPGLEAMAAGAQVIVSDIPVFKEIYKDSASYFNPHDFSSIQMVLEDVLVTENKKKDAIIKRGKEFVKRYSWSKMATQTLQVYNRALK